MAAQFDYNQHAERRTGESLALPPLVLPVGIAQVETICVQATDLAASEHEMSDGHQAVLIMLWGPQRSPLPEDSGLFMSISAEDVRAFAAGILRSADTVDGGAIKQ